MEEQTEFEDTGIIGGADGPTAIFFEDKTHKPTLLQRVQRFFSRTKRHFIVKRIVPGTHTLEEVEEYLKSRYGMEA